MLLSDLDSLLYAVGVPHKWRLEEEVTRQVPHVERGSRMVVHCNITHTHGHSLLVMTVHPDPVKWSPILESPLLRVITTT